MQKLILFLFTILSCTLLSQSSEYRYLTIEGQEGITNSTYFRLGKETLCEMLKSFEKKFTKNYPEYSKYYRIYQLPGGRKASSLRVLLVPKNIVSEEDRRNKKYKVVGDKRTMAVRFDLKTHELSAPFQYTILPEL